MQAQREEEGQDVSMRGSEGETALVALSAVVRPFR